MQSAIVTGGSRGIGAATARLLASRGWAVAVVYVSNAAAADEVVAACGTDALSIQADVSVEADVVRIFETVDSSMPALGALVNNAGIVTPQHRVDELDGAALARTFAVNAIGPFLCAREAIKRMSTRHGGTGGTIVNVSTSAVRHGSAGEYVDYAASKGAVDVMTMGLAREVGDEGIRVNAVRPGLVLTDIHASGGRPNRPAEIAPQVPMKRAGTPEEIAAAIAWLCSDEASYVTGAVLDVSGGR